MHHELAVVEDVVRHECVAEPAYLDNERLVFTRELLERLLQTVVEFSGDEVRFALPGQPAVVHGVRHVFAAPTFLPAWPSADTATRIWSLDGGNIVNFKGTYDEFQASMPKA